MKKYLISILFFINFFAAYSQENQNYKTFQYRLEFYFISVDSVETYVNFKWYDSNHDTVNLVDHFVKQFAYPEFCKKEEIEGSFYFKVYVDSIGVITKVEGLKPIGSCTIEIAKELKKIMWMGFLVSRKEYPYEYFVLKLVVKKNQY